MMQLLTPVIPLLTAAVALLLSLVVVARRRRTLAQWAFAIGLSGMAVLEVGTYLVSRSPAPGPLTSLWVRGLALGEALMVLGWILFGAVFAKDDPVLPLQRRWTKLAAGMGLLVLLLPLVSDPFQVIATPDGRPSLALTGSGWLSSTAVLLGAVFALARIERVFRVTRGEVRRTITLFVLGLAGAVAFHILVLSQLLLFATLELVILWVEAAAFLLSLGLMAFALVRYRLFEVQIFVSRQVIYRSVAVAVVGIYLLGLGVAGELMRRFGIPVKFSVVVLVVFSSALGLAFLLSSEQTRRRARRFIDTHFYQSKYDYRREWTEFTRKLTSVVSLEGILPRISQTLTETMGLERVVIFLAEPDGGFRPAETIGLPGAAPGLPAGVVEWFPPDPREPLVLAKLEAGGPAAEMLAPLDTLGLVALVPLVAKGEVVGVLAVGPALDRKPFTYEDYDLLATVAAQAATTVLNARLAEELARTRALEALHRVSSFALHDLKNLVATLSLVTQNAAERGGDPAFQRDALRAIEGSVRQMRDLIARLSDLPKPFDLRREPTDVNGLVHETVEQLKPLASARVALVEEFGRVPPVAADPDHLQKAVYNLLLNAVEAITGPGEVRVRTAAVNGAVVLEVEDSGQGIPDSLLKDGLFTPFRSTKRRGLGIGLYQVKTIVEAHGGRITVTSRIGEGTTFRLDLPITGT